MRSPLLRAVAFISLVFSAGCRAILGIGDPHEVVVDAGDDSGAPDGVGGAMPPAAPDAMAGLSQTPPSCAGLPSNCGATHDQSCCASLLVPGGTFYRHNDPGYPATLSDFFLDRYEITVGRMRRFVEAYERGFRPQPGDGEHPGLPGSGWQTAWEGRLPPDKDQLESMMLKCPDSGWSASPDDDRHPVTCLTYHLAFAFCAWDGGRLPTRAEWSYAAAGGSEQRSYPWVAPGTAEVVDRSHANFDRPCLGCSAKDLLEVGSLPLGDGRWGHADLPGNAWEWNLDAAGPMDRSCHDCARLDGDGSYVIAGGSVIDMVKAISVKDGYNTSDGKSLWFLQGARCARDR